MPYETVKIIKKLSDTPMFGFQLEDDNIWKRFHFYERDINDIWIIGTVAELLEKDGRIKRVVYKPYKFQVLPTQYGKNETRTLYLPYDFVRAYPVCEGMPVHIFLNTILRENGTEKTPIFDEIERGIMDVEPKNELGEVILHDSLIIHTQTDDYYSSLVTEINRAFNYKVPNATLVMLRKFFENLIVDLLKARYRNEVSLYFSIETHRHLSLNNLIPNLRGKFNELTIDDENFYREKENFFRFLDSIKQYGDASAHVLSPLEKNMDKINALKPSINKYSDQIIQLIKKHSPTS